MQFDNFTSEFGESAKWFFFIISYKLNCWFFVLKKYVKLPPFLRAEHYSLQGELEYTMSLVRVLPTWISSSLQGNGIICICWFRIFCCIERACEVKKSGIRFTWCPFVLSIHTYRGKIVVTSGEGCIHISIIATLNARIQQYSWPTDSPS